MNKNCHFITSLGYGRWLRTSRVTKKRIAWRKSGLDNLKKLCSKMITVYRVSQKQGVGRTDDLLYFKCLTTKQMWCPVNAYLK
jgi:hypothetical protein